MTRDDLIDMAVREAMLDAQTHLSSKGWNFYPQDCLHCQRCVAVVVKSNWPRHLEAVKGRVG